tara:strand:+ start:129 stop:824 length:696 start_codon:yes stop_codon:yes gene_type:complete
MEKIYRIGTRTSPLALKQVDEVLESLRKFYPDIKAEVVGIDTYGDKDKQTPISDIEGSDFFTKEIDQALISGQIDFAVHSAKDLADTLNESLLLAAVTDSIDPYDVIVSKGDVQLNDLAKGAKIGTSSKRRKEQIKKYRPDFEIIDIRGNIGQRLKLLDESGLDAVLLAAAGLIRLGLEERISQRISISIVQPHPLQGALAIVVKKASNELLKLLSVLDQSNLKSKVFLRR